jgi:hypothetical protein
LPLRMLLAITETTNIVLLCYGPQAGVRIARVIAVAFAPSKARRA